MSSENTTIQSYIRFAPYIESRHEDFLITTDASVNSAILRNPYIDYDSSYLAIGMGLSTIESIYEYFGSHLSGFNIELLWTEVFNNRINSSEINEVFLQEKKLFNDEFIKKIDEYALQMRDINAVISSSFIVGKAKLESQRIKKLSNISSHYKCSMIPEISKDFLISLKNQKSEVIQYITLMKIWYQFKIDTDDMDTNVNARKVLWPFTVLDFEGLALNAIKGVRSYKKTLGKRNRSELSKGLLMQSSMITGMFTGMYYGSMIGGPYGALIGISIGFNVGIAQLMYEHGHGDRMAFRYWATGGMSGPWDLAFEPIY